MQRLSCCVFHRRCHSRSWTRRANIVLLRFSSTTPLVQAWLASEPVSSRLKRYTDPATINQVETYLPLEDERSTSCGVNEPIVYPRPAGNDSSRHSIFIKNLPFNATANDLIDEFSELKGFIGARIPFDHMTKRTKGYGFIDFADPDSAEAAMVLDGKVTLDGRDLSLERAKTAHIASKKGKFKPWSTIYVGNTGRDMTADQLRRHFGRFGFVKTVIIPGRGDTTTENYAHVRFVDVQTATRVVKDARAMIAYGRNLTLEYTRSPVRKKNDVLKG